MRNTTRGSGSLIDGRRFLWQIRIRFARTPGALSRGWELRRRGAPPSAAGGATATSIGVTTSADRGRSRGGDRRSVHHCVGLCCGKEGAVVGAPPRRCFGRKTPGPRSEWLNQADAGFLPRTALSSADGQSAAVAVRCEWLRRGRDARVPRERCTRHRSEDRQVGRGPDGLVLGDSSPEI